MMNRSKVENKTKLNGSVSLPRLTNKLNISYPNNDKVK